MFLRTLVLLPGFVAAINTSVASRQASDEVNCANFYANYNGQDATQTCFPWDVVIVNAYSPGDITIQARCVQSLESNNAINFADTTLYVCPLLNYDRDRQHLHWSDGLVANLLLQMGIVVPGNHMGLFQLTKILLSTTFQGRQCMWILPWHYLHIREPSE
jgi:hypothetical protein